MVVDLAEAILAMSEDDKRRVVRYVGTVLTTQMIADNLTEDESKQVMCQVVETTYRTNRESKT